MADMHDSGYYAKCMIGGALACGSTHILILPLDIIKCKMQVNPSYSNNVWSALKKVFNAKQATLGWAPTAIGYSIQGSGKFGFYQIFKDLYKKIAGDKAQKYRKFGWSIASSMAQIIADLFLCPFEAVKLKVQLSRPGAEYPQKILPAFLKLHKEQKLKGFYKGLIPLWSRQVPYTVVKFVLFQLFVQFLYDNIFTLSKQSYSKATQLSITFGAGFLAGVFCAIVSHPADTLLSKIYSRGDEKGSTKDKLKRIYKQIGFRGLWAGLSTRILMIGTIAALQWWIYDSFKTLSGLETTGGKSKKQE